MTEKRDYVKSVCLPKSYKRIIEYLAKKEHLKPAAFQAKIIMDGVDEKVKNLTNPPKWLKENVG